jgi:hypothetical protein
MESSRCIFMRSGVEAGWTIVARMERSAMRESEVGAAREADSVDQGQRIDADVDGQRRCHKGRDDVEARRQQESERKQDRLGRQEQR